MSHVSILFVPVWVPLNVLFKGCPWIIRSCSFYCMSGGKQYTCHNIRPLSANKDVFDCAMSYFQQAELNVQL